MQPKKSKHHDRLDGAEPSGRSDPARAKFTTVMVAALQELERRKPPSKGDLGHRAYQKLQYDIPLVSEEELEGLTHSLRNSLQMKSAQPSFPLTSKLLENLMAGARAPLAVSKLPASSVQGQACGAAPGAAASDASAAASTTDQRMPNGHDVDPLAAASAALQPPGEEMPPLPSSLTQADPLSNDRQGLSTAYRTLCATVFVQLVSHCLTVSEQDTWILLHAVATDDGELDDGPGAEEGEQRRSGEACNGPAEGPLPTGEHCASEGPGAPYGGGTAAGAIGSLHAGDTHEQGDLSISGGQLEANGSSATGVIPVAGATHAGPGTAQAVSSFLASLSIQDGNGRDAEQQGEATALTQEGGQKQPSYIGYEAAMAAEEDGDDFVFEDLETSAATATATAEASSSGRNSTAVEASWFPSSCSPAVPSLPLLPAYTWPALRRRLLLLASNVSYALLDDPDLWRDGELLQGVFQLLRALGAHRHAQELQPLLHAYVGLVADRLAAAPDELGCLDNLWDAVGLPCISSLPPQVRRQRAAANGSSSREPAGQVLLAEASTCLSLVASLAGQLTATSARLRLWQQVHRHMLPLLERCLGELARGVGQGPAASKAAPAGKATGSGGQGGAEPKAPGPEDVAAIVLVCQVLDFYVQQRPGNADLVSALKGTGVLASLCVLFAAAAALPGAEPLRSAALCCAASSRELYTWMLAVPGVSQAAKGPSFQEGGPYEAHGAVWELLGDNGASPLALSILSGGTAPDKAVRVHGLLQLLGKVAACRGGRGGALWSPALERALRELFAALREEQAAGAALTRAALHEQAGISNRPNALMVQDADEGRSAGLTTEANGDGGVQSHAEEDDVDDDDDKLQLLDPAALQRRRAQQLHPACWRILKQLLTAGGDSGGKTD